MTDVSSKVIVSLKDGTIQIEGAEGFVREQLALFMDVIKTHLATLAKGPLKATGKESPGKEKESPVPSGDLAAYENLFAVADDNIQVLKDLPGASKAEKSVSAALLLSFANELNGTDQTSYEVVRDLCQAHSCLDGTNFSKTLAAEKDAFIVSGTPRKRVIKLTVPGRKRAKALADSLNT